MTVKEIVLEYLKAQRFDGLCNVHDCGCAIDDLMPCCNDSIEHCQPGYKVLCTECPYYKHDECVGDPGTSGGCILSERPKKS